MVEATTEQGIFREDHNDSNDQQAPLLNMNSHAVEN